MQRLAGKTAIITGAASGIGRGTAEVFAEHGARLVLVDRDGPGLEIVRAELAAQGAQAIMFEGDVSQAAAIDGVVALALASFGRIDVVFNNAGIMPFGDLATLDLLKAFGVEPEVLEPTVVSDLTALRRNLFSRRQPPERDRTGEVRVFSAPGESRDVTLVRSMQ